MSRPITLTALGLVLALGVASCAQQGPSGTEASVAAPMATATTIINTADQ